MIKYIILMMVLLLPTGVTAGYKEQGRELAEKLHAQGFNGGTGEADGIKQRFSENPQNKGIGTQNGELQSVFETHYDSGNKKEDPLKGYFAQKNLQVSQQKHSHQPSLTEAEQSLKQKHRFKIDAQDRVFEKYEAVSNARIENSEGILLQSQPKPTPLLKAEDKTVTCRISAAGEERSCVKKRLIRLVPKPPIIKNINLSLNVSAGGRVRYSVNLITGQVSAGGGTWSANVTPQLNSVDSKSSIQLLSQQYQHTMPRSDGTNWSDGAGFIVEQYPSAANHFTLTLVFFQRLQGGNYGQDALINRNVRYGWRITIPQEPDIQEYWEGCEALERYTQDGFCELIDSEPQELQKAKVIPGLSKPVTREYWSEVKKFHCGAGKGVDECEAYRQQKCEQVNSKCIAAKNGFCIEYESTFKCYAANYLKGDGLVLNGNEIRLMKGPGSVEEGYFASDFGEAITQFNALTEMGKNMQDGLGGIGGNPDDPSIFHGKCSQCRVNLGSFFRDCCRLKGVLQGLFGRCNEEERKLAIAALRNKRCVKIDGRYCHKKVLGKCVEKRDSYCCYGSQLARIIQEIAHHQLGIAWGDAEHPNCSSLTASQLSRINFDDPYAQQKLSEILAEVQATAQQKFEWVQSAVSELKNIQGKVDALEQQQKKAMTQQLLEAGKNATPIEKANDKKH